MTRIVSVFTGALAITAFTATMIAQAPAGAPPAPSAQAAAGAKSVSDGVYTADQAKRGEAIYKEQCAACHGDNLEGSGPMPALAGPDFTKSWMGKTVADLFDKTHSSMPATAPGSLTEKQTADVLAYLLSVSKYPAGATELADSIEPLKSISLDAKQ
jgi:mono/diheme cytochrome c family protein